MSASKFNTCTLGKSFSIAYGAIVIALLSHRWFLINRNTCFIKTRETLLFTSESTAWMTTNEHFVASLIHQLDTNLLSAYISECGFDRWWCSFNFWITVSTFTWHLMIFEFFTSFSDVIGFCLTLAAKILLAFLTSYSKLAHVNSRILRNRLPCVIFNFVIDISRNHFHYVLAATGDQVRILWEKDRFREFVDLLHKLLAQ